MSFHWNLSSEDEFEGEEDESQQALHRQHGETTTTTTTTAQAIVTTPKNKHGASFTSVVPTKTTTAAAANTAIPSINMNVSHDKNFDSDDNDSDDDEDIDWEDMDNDDNEREQDTKPDAFATLRAVTIDIGTRNKKHSRHHNHHDDDDDDNNTQKKNKKRARKVYRNGSLDPVMANLLMELHKTNLLTLMSRTILSSQCCSNQMILHLAHSLIPSHFIISSQQQQQKLSSSSSSSSSSSLLLSSLPTLEQVKQFCQWYYPWINQVHERRRLKLRSNRAAGASLSYSNNSFPSSTMRRKQRRKQQLQELPNDHYNHDALSDNSWTWKATTNTVNSHDMNLNGRSPSTILLDPEEYMIQRLTRLCSYLSTLNDENPQLFQEEYDDNNNNDYSTSAAALTAPTMKTMLLIAMFRSMGWRARHVMALEPIRQDLDIHHPIFMTTTTAMATKSIFDTILKNKKNTITTTTKSSKNDKLEIKKKSHDSNHSNNKNGVLDDDESKLPAQPDHATRKKDDPLEWIEILCSSSTSSSSNHRTKLAASSSSTTVMTNSSNNSSNNNNHHNDNNIKGQQQQQWIHIDVESELIHAPRLVEAYLYAKHANASTSSSSSFRTATTKGILMNSKQQQRRIPVVYVLGVEHLEEKGNSNTTTTPITTTTTTTTTSSMEDTFHPLRFRLTDVTPRYANSWSKSQRLRGEECHAWFRDTIHLLNHKNKKTKNNNGTTGSDVGHGHGTVDSNRKSHHDTVSAAFTSASQSIRKDVANYHDDVIELDNDDDDDDHHHVENKNDGVHNDGKGDEEIVDDEDDDDDNDDELDAAEQAELSAMGIQETMPTTKIGFKNHVVYALKSQLGKYQVLTPDAKKCGLFKGEYVYQRKDVCTIRTAKKWLYEGRKVKDGEKPIKRVKARKKPTSTGAAGEFRPLDTYGVGVSNDGSDAFRNRQIELGSSSLSDGMEDLFAPWQTKSWSPPYIGPNDDIPVHDKYKNIELALINPGLVHLDVPRMAKVAKKLGIPYAPCLMGFEGHGGNRAPTIRGIVVHEHNVELLQEAFTEFEHFAVQQEEETRQTKVWHRWKKLIHGILLKDRLEREYGTMSDKHSVGANNDNNDGGNDDDDDDDDNDGGNDDNDGVSDDDDDDSGRLGF